MVQGDKREQLRIGFHFGEWVLRLRDFEETALVDWVCIVLRL